ncbi:hypothetical protein Patl1_07690 [Pistacia atlantica]|uniref:Uncharacterized protein n=1 Tax=Pistacia atlantica TaxID=434234 RepID=A0ACC1ALJ7_9ROSI|nr:hypothetical protein Patl1_07690 [Pistacia atlantica]
MENLFNLLYAVVHDFAPVFVCVWVHMHASAFASMLYSVDLTYLHVLVVPKRVVKRVFDLTADETSDLWLSAQCFYLSKMSSMDRPEAEQSMPHVHIHILPRKSGDFERNDEIYDAIDGKEKEL